MRRFAGVLWGRERKSAALENNDRNRYWRIKVEKLARQRMPTFFMQVIGFASQFFGVETKETHETLLPMRTIDLSR